MTLGFENLSSVALLPPEMREPVGMMRFFHAIPGFNSFVRSQVGLSIFEWLTALLLFLGVIGWRTRAIIPLATLCYFLYGGIVRDYTFFWHQGLVLLYIMAVLSLTPCGDGLSVDRLRRARLGASVPAADATSPIHGWSRYACWVVIALTYVSGGLSKLYYGGPFWWEPVNIQRHLYSTSLGLTFFFDKPLSLHLNPDNGIPFAVLGIIGIYGELAYGFVLFSRKARYVIPLAMGMTHIGIFLFQDILFFDLIFLPLIFIDFAAIRRLGEPVRVGYPSTPIHSTLKTDLKRIRYPALIYYPLLVSALTAILMSAWLLKIEFYPFTAVQMFSGKDTSGQVSYTKVIGHYESGTAARMIPEKIIPAAFDDHYAEDIKRCLSDDLEERQVCEKLLATVGSVYNQKNSSKEKMIEVEVQEWQYNFRESRSSNSSYGKLMKRSMIEIN
ncbi:MAG: hypothetical protein WBB01_22870 [Phormidesmis sp.]